MAIQNFSLCISLSEIGLLMDFLLFKEHSGNTTILCFYLLKIQLVDPCICFALHASNSLPCTCLLSIRASYRSSATGPRAATASSSSPTQHWHPWCSRVLQWPDVRTCIDHDCLKFMCSQTVLKIFSNTHLSDYFLISLSLCVQFWFQPCSHGWY